VVVKETPKRLLITGIIVWSSLESAMCFGEAVNLTFSPSIGFWLEDIIRSRGESSAELRPLSERLLKPPPQLICLALRNLPEVLFKLSLQLVQRAFDLKLVHGNLDI
jgi:hypothetical protein